MAEDVKWYWHSDNGWVAYPTKQNHDLENGFQTKKSKVKIDSERYVDMENLLQRRYTWFFPFKFYYREELCIVSFYTKANRLNFPQR